MAKGRVTRGAADTAVTLTASLRLGAATRTVELPVTVLAASEHTREDDEAYMFVYFRDNTIDGEKIRFAVSEGNDALNWRTLNNANPVLESTQGDMGLRDPFVLRSKEGDRFFLIATDLSAARKGFPTDNGSRYLEIWGVDRPRQLGRTASHRGLTSQRGHDVGARSALRPHHRRLRRVLVVAPLPRRRAHAGKTATVRKFSWPRRATS